MVHVRYNRYLMMGVILLTALFLILAAEAYNIFHPLSNQIPSRSMDYIETSYGSIVVGILLPLTAAVLYVVARQKKNKTADT